MAILTPGEIERGAEVHDEWERRVGLSPSLYRLYQSPLWWDHVRATRGDDPLRMLVARDEEGAIRGLMPCELTTLTVSRKLAGRAVRIFRARGVDLLGSEPLTDEDPALFDALVAALWRAFPGAHLCRAKSVPTGGRFWQHMQAGPHAGASYFVTPDHLRPFYSIRLGDSWDEYLSRFNAKQRNDLRRKQRILSEAARGRLVLRRFDTVESVAGFYRDLELILKDAWLQEVKRLPSILELQDAAQRGFLRTYLLYADRAPIAYVIGYQLYDVFHYAMVAFSLEFGRYSPGTVLLFQIVRDLCEYRPVRWLNFGIGGAEYKRRFSNVRAEDATVYLMRKTALNRLRSLALRSLTALWRLRNRHDGADRAGSDAPDVAGATREPS